MIPLRRRRGDPGFTLLELLLSVFIFSMVIAGLSVIYATAFNQGFRTIQESDLKVMGAIASRALQTQLAQATMLQTPAAGGNSDSLRGFTNATMTNGALFNTLTPAAAWNPAAAGWFYFCVQTAAVGACEAAPALGKGCIVAYIGGSGYFTGGVSCGDPAGGVTPMVLSQWVKVDTGAPSSSNYFSRAAGDSVRERNQVRANFRLFRPPTKTTMLISYDVDMTMNMIFSQDNP